MAGFAGVATQAVGSQQQAITQFVSGFVERSVEADNFRYYRALGEAQLATGRRRTAQTIGRARVNFAKAGIRIDVGTPKDFELFLQEEGELAALEASFGSFEKARRAKHRSKTAVGRGVIKALITVASASASGTGELLERAAAGTQPAIAAGQPGGPPIVGMQGPLFQGSGTAGSSLFNPNNAATTLDASQFQGFA